MFRKISYLCMVASVLLSWGLLVNIGLSSDRNVDGTPGPDAIPVRVAKSLRSSFGAPAAEAESGYRTLTRVPRITSSIGLLPAVRKAKAPSR